MALIKEYEVPQGVVGTHHRLQKVEILPGENRVDILFAVYFNEQARIDNKTPLYYEAVSIPLDNFAEDPRTVFYTAARLHLNSYLANAVNSVTPDQSTNVNNVVSIRNEFVASQSLINET